MAARGAGERNAVAFEVGNFQPEHHFADGRLLGRTLHRRFIDPISTKAKSTAYDELDDMHSDSWHADSHPRRDKPNPKASVASSGSSRRVAHRRLPCRALRPGSNLWRV